MKDEEIGGLLKLVFLTRPLTDTDDPELRMTGNRLRKRFIAALFTERNPRPIKELTTKLPLGIWLSQERAALKLDPHEVAAILDVTPDYVTRVEGGSIKPWQLSLDFCGRLMHLTRLHFDGLAVLVRNAASTSQMIGINSAQARCRGGNMTASRGDAVSKALEMFKAHNADSVRDEQAEDWLGSLRTHLLQTGDELVD